MTIDKPLSLGELYHPTLADIYSHVLYACCIISIGVFFITVYTIIKKSTFDMSEFKYILLAQCFWNFLFDLLLNAWQPIIILPFFLAYSKGVAKFVGLKQSYIFVQAVFFAASGLLHCLMFSLFYRMVQIFYGTKFYDAFKSKRLLLLIYFLSGAAFIGAFQASCIVFLSSGLINKAEEINSRLSSPSLNNPQGHPALNIIFKLEPSTSGCDLDLCGQVLNIAMTIIGPVVIISSFFGGTICTISIARLKRLNKNASQITFKLHKMFMQILSIQFTLFILLLIIPILIIYFSFYFEWPFGSFVAIISMTLPGFHSLSSFLVILYFIKPYRVFISKKLIQGAVKLKLIEKPIQIEHVVRFSQMSMRFEGNESPRTKSRIGFV